ncbi:MAG: 1-acyl-sn-glycerol-3-phosphate acyltransferase [Anaerolineales bacterium]|nr:1-acyl-sn-glycerol-3-phosphate acyltransferase [Anaerolineales bacterium]
MTQPKPITEVWKPELVRLPKLTLARKLFRWFAHNCIVKLTAKLLLNVSVEGMENFPKTGPLLIVINHIGDADAVAVVSQLPNPPDALGKIELCDLPILGKLMHWYGIIWLHRGRPDIRAIKSALDGLAENRIIIIAPEGRYSLTGALEEGSGGAAFLAYKSGAPVLPITVTGTENENVYGSLKKFKRAKVHVKVGKMLKVSNQFETRQEAVSQGTSQIMEALANLLPEKYRGEYL